MIRLELSRFHTYCKAQLGLSAHSLRAYRQDLRTFVRFLQRFGDAEEVSAELLVQYREYLRDEVGASPATIRRRFVTLRAYYRWFEVEEEGFVSPFTGLRLELKVPQRLPRPVDRPTLAALFRTAGRQGTVCNGDSQPSTVVTSEAVTALIARLLVVTGMRVGEATHLRLCDVSGGGTQIRVHGKGNRERTVYVTNTRLLDDFRRYWEARSRVDAPTAFLFLNSWGNRLSEAAFRKRLRAISDTLMIAPHLTPHRFRHSAATLLIEEGVDIRIVQRLLGHASISTTELYTKVSDNSLVAAISQADTLAQVDV